jgi:hypothetical protein
MHDDIASRAISDDFAFGENNAPIRNSSNYLNIVGCNDYCMPVGGQLRKNFN